MSVMTEYKWACSMGCPHMTTIRSYGYTCTRWNDVLDRLPMCYRDTVRLPAEDSSMSVAIKVIINVSSLVARSEKCLRLGRKFGVRVPECSGVLQLPEETARNGRARSPRGVKQARIHDNCSKDYRWSIIH